MDPTACLNRIMELQAELTELGKQFQYKDGDKIRNSGHCVYTEWKECWDNLMEWLIKGGFPPTCTSLKSAGKCKSANVWKDRTYLLSDRGANGKQATIALEGTGFVMSIYSQNGDMIDRWVLPQ